MDALSVRFGPISLTASREAFFLRCAELDQAAQALDRQRFTFTGAEDSAALSAVSTWCYAQAQARVANPSVVIDAMKIEDLNARAAVLLRIARSVKRRQLIAGAAILTVVAGGTWYVVRKK